MRSRIMFKANMFALLSLKFLNHNSKTKKEQSKKLDCSSYKKAATYSPTCVVPSALKGLTALFGMVRGETFDYNHLKTLVVSTLVLSR